MSTAEYVFPNQAVFETVVTAVARGEESDVNGLWCSDILQTYFPYKAPVTYVMKPEVNLAGGRIDLLVTRQVIDGPNVTWPWVLIYEGKKTAGATWDVVRAQVVGYFRGSRLQKIYGVGCIGRNCKFWEWDQVTHPNEEFQLQKDSQGRVVPKRGQFNPSDISSQSLDVEAYIRFVKGKMV
jgi:hypothetical protein